MMDADSLELPDNEREQIGSPVVVYTANGNIEAHSVVVWLESNGIAAYAVEDNSGVSTFAFGTTSQFHKPKVYVDKPNLSRAQELLVQFEHKRAQRRAEQENAPPITSECEECGAESVFPASQDGTTQNCPKCNAFMDVGSLGWAEDFDYGQEEDVNQRTIDNLDDGIDAASELENSGEWEAAIVAYRDLATRWPEHAIYLNNCIAAVQAKIDAVR